MKKWFPLLLTGVLLAAVGCDTKTYPSGAVDTSDPNKTYGTMAPLSKGGAKDPTKLGGMPKGPGGK